MKTKLFILLLILLPIILLPISVVGCDEDSIVIEDFKGLNTANIDFGKNRAWDVWNQPTKAVLYGQSKTSSLPMKIDTIKTDTVEFNSVHHEEWSMISVRPSYRWIHIPVLKYTIDTTYILTPEQVKKALTDDVPCGMAEYFVEVDCNGKTNHHDIIVRQKHPKYRLICISQTDRNGSMSFVAPSYNCNCNK